MKRIAVLIAALIFVLTGSFVCAEDLDSDFSEYDFFDDDFVFYDIDEIADFDDVGTLEEYMQAIDGYSFDEDIESSGGETSADNQETEGGQNSDDITVAPDEQAVAEHKEKIRRINDISGYHDPDLRNDGDYAYYISEDNTYCITSLYKGSSSDVVVPSTLGGYPVRIIGDHTFENKGFIHSVEVPDGVVAIGKQAFFMCINLQTVIVPEGVILFGDQCFAACYMLDYIQVPDSLESVGEMAFLGCYALREIEFGENLKFIGSCAFHTCRELERVTVPSSNVQIDGSAFLQCPDTIEIIYLHKS